MNYKNIFNRKELKTIGSSPRSSSTFVEAVNHPGRNQSLQCFNYRCAAATPPSKGGESNINELKFDIKICLPLLILPAKLFSNSFG